MPDRHWDVRHLHLEVTVDPGAGTISGTATHTVAPLGRRSGHLRLDQTSLDITAVRINDAVVESWRSRPGVLEIPMPVIGDKFEVAVDWTAHPETGIHFRVPDEGADRILEAWTHGQTEDNQYWFPCWDYPNDRFTYTATITAPEALHATTNGVMVEKAPATTGWTRWSYALEQSIPTYLVALAVGEYAVYTEPAPVPLEFIVPSRVSEAQARQTTGNTGSMVAWFNKVLGTDYPYPVYRQLFVQRFLYSGMENASLTILSDRFLFPIDGDRGALTEMLLAHELAHQWFGDLLTCYGWRELWLNESFATYFAARWQAEARGPEFFATTVYRWHEDALTEPVPLAIRSWAKAGDREAASPRTLYGRGGIVLHLLREYLGAEVFDAAIRTYVRDNQDRLVESSDLRRALEDASGTHLGWLFDQFVYRHQFPEVRTAWTWEDAKLEVVLEQVGEGEPVSAPVEVEIGTDSETRTYRVWLEEGSTKLLVELPMPPAWVAVDPEGTLPVVWSREQDPTAWVKQLHHSRSPHARLVAMARLGEGDGGEEAVRALASVLRDQHLNGHFRYHAAHALGRIAVPSAVEALSAAADDPSERVREGVAEGLGKVPVDGKTAKTLEDLFRGDSDAMVRAAALRSLVHQDRDRALWLARRRVVQPNVAADRWELGAAIEVLQDNGDQSDMARLLPLTARAVPHDIRVAALVGSVTLLERVEDEGRRERLRERISRRLEPLLEDRDLRVRAHAVALLGEVGDEAAAATLTAYANTTSIDWVREAALEEAARIRTRGEDPEAAPTPREAIDVERLEERVKSLEERLHRLEEWRY
jgi:aminopeptidase N